MSERLSKTFCALLLVLAPISAHAQLIVHEWGTMTTLHAPDGTPQTRLNRIEAAEILPAFVAHFEPPQAGAAPFTPFAKGTRTPGRPDVTMRLETPVLYFYDRGNVVAGRGFDVRVRMHGGVLNDFYPPASAGMQRNGVGQDRRPQQISLDASWTGTLEWKDVMLDDTAAMQSELVAAGLYADEAKAMLTTWQASYFRQPGLRVFYMAPRAWTDHFLPLELSVPHTATRVLVGRIDLMTTDETT